MKLSRTAIGLYMGLVFASGVMLGGFGQRLYTAASVSAKTTKNPEEFRKNYVAEMRTRLKLTDQQVQKLNLILDETNAQYQAEFKAEREKRVPALQQIRQHQIDRINAELSASQQSEYERMRKEREEKQKQDRQKRGPGPGPGF